MKKQFAVGDKVRLTDQRDPAFRLVGTVENLSPSTLKKRGRVRGHGLQWSWRVKFDDPNQHAGYFAECFLEKVA